jgi:cold shock CspA family protein/ribosome-associated translation inhibitor RaiA
MQLPFQITFRGLASSESIERVSRDKAQRLERLHGRITSCHVIIEAPPRHHRKGGTFRVNVKLTVPGGEVHADRESSRNHAYEDLHVALRDAFAAAGRQLEQKARVRRGDVKTHSMPLHGRVDRFDPERGFGYLETSDGLEVYFHRNAVLGGAHRKLSVGDDVRLTLAEDASPHGPHASFVEPA